MPSAQITLIQRLYSEFYNERNLTIATQVATSIFRYPQRFVNDYTVLRTASPDAQITPELILQDGNRVTVRWSLRGTHLGVFSLPQVTVPPTGRTVEVLGISIFEVSGSRIISGISASSGGLEMLRHLGVQFVLTSPPASPPPRRTRRPRRP